VTLAALSAAGARITRTDEAGAIMVTTDGDALEISLQRGAERAIRPP
jgi:beta-lactamase superfamily II metal-dependent hydrolase